MAFPPLVPCLWFDDQAEAAGAFYVRTFASGRILGTSRFPSSGENPAGKPPGSVLTVEFEIAGQRFTALNGGPAFVPNPTVSFFVHLDSPGEAQRLFAALVEGGQALMPLDTYPWSECYGWVQDRFGVSWQVFVGGRRGGPAIAPCLMFAGDQHGRAEQALRHYASAFSGAELDVLERYAPAEGPPATVKHARLRLGEQALCALDSHLHQGPGFNEALSLQVMCADQAEVDHFWDALGAGGAPGPCGWLKDRFGFSWQIVPTAVSEWMLSDDAAARDRAFAAMLGMQKLDVAVLERAYKG